MQPKIDGLSIAALALILFLGANLLNDASPASGASLADQPAAQTPTPPPIQTDPEDFAAPYATFTLTQGLHGASYGHMAIDIAAGEGVTILSPIHGEVTEYYLDEWGNPILIIENEIYRVTLMHGDYSVSVGQSVALGEPVGVESNQGYTTDLAGNPCWERSGCGYHTHLNVFDKIRGENVDPLELINR